MMDSKIEIRAARPEDAEAAAPLIYSSGPAAFDYIFAHRTKVDAISFLKKAFVHLDGEFGYGNHFVCVCDGRIVGAGAGFTGNDMKGNLIAMLRSILPCYGIVQTIAIAQRGTQLEHLIPPPKGDDYCIAHLGVDPALRGSGIGSKLIRFLLDRAESRGLTSAFLDVSVENPRAEALYTRMGFDVVAENKSNLSNETATVPDHRRMVRTIP